MNLLSVENLAKAFGDRVLFNNVSFGINAGEKKALVAQNGSGKSTLISILKGKELPDEGKITFRKGIEIAFLDQEPEMNENSTVIDILLKSENRFTQVIRKYESLIHSENPDPKEMDLTMNLMTELNAWEYENHVKEILFRFKINNLQQKIGELSGGQKRRVALAEVLIRKPDMMVLDEPTNHLDIEMVEWLENYLSNSNSGVLMVTHDRYFLDNVCNEILEIDQQKLHVYKGNFEYYLEKKAEREAIFISETEKARNTYRKELEWMRKMPKARGTKAKARITSFYEVEEKAKQRLQKEELNMEIRMNRMGGKILEIKNLCKSLNNQLLIDHFTYTFKSGDRIGIIGANGCGKSTLLNILTNKLDYDSGHVQAGETVVFGYYNQSGISFKEGQRVIESVREIADFIPTSSGASISASQLLNRFNFPPERQYSYVSKLSGGEKRRLYLLMLLMKNPNFLILDEPTNDLDLLTLETLESFLSEFKGCLLIVSHDRYFLDKLCDHVFVFEGEGKIKDYPGTYGEYKEWKEIENEKQKSSLKKEIANEEKSKAENKEKKKLSYKEQREFELLESEIARLESEKKEVELKISQEPDFEKLNDLSEKYKLIEISLEQKSNRWLELAELQG